MKAIFTGLLGMSLALAMGCSKATTGGNPNSTNKPIAGLSDDTFKLTAPTLSTTIKQGGTKEVTIKIKRGTNFKEDVALKFEGWPKGVKVEQDNPNIKAGDEDYNVKLRADEDAAIGDFEVTVTGHPGKGADAAEKFKLKVEKK